MKRMLNSIKSMVTLDLPFCPATVHKSIEHFAFGAGNFRAICSELDGEKTQQQHHSIELQDGHCQVRCSFFYLINNEW